MRISPNQLGERESIWHVLEEFYGEADRELDDVDREIIPADGIVRARRVA